MWIYAFLTHSYKEWSNDFPKSSWFDEPILPPCSAISSFSRCFVSIALNINVKLWWLFGIRRWHGNPRRHIPSSSNSDCITKGGANAVTIRNMVLDVADRPLMTKRESQTNLLKNYQSKCHLKRTDLRRQCHRQAIQLYPNERFVLISSQHDAISLTDIVVVDVAFLHDDLLLNHYCCHCRKVMASDTAMFHPGLN